MNRTVFRAAPVANDVDQWDLDRIVDRLRVARERWRHTHARDGKSGARSFPSRPAIEKILADIFGALFPMRLGPPDLREDGEDYFVGHTLSAVLDGLHTQVRLELGYSARQVADDMASVEEKSRTLIRQFAATIPDIRESIDLDVEAAYVGDPAAQSVDEVMLCYPGIRALICYRIANRLYRLGAPLVARIISDVAHSETGIDIHPGATIGTSFFIDHGTGVVIGETAVIGDRVRVYQAVTLGAKRFPQNEDGTLQKGLPRHPIVEDDVVIYAGATILGRVTVGRGSTIGGNVWLTDSVPPGSAIAQARMTSK